MKRRTALATLGAALAIRPIPTLAQTAQALQPLRVFGTALDASGAMFYAKDLGTFAKYGLDVELNSPNSNSLSISSLVSGAVDISYTNVISGEEAFRKGVPITMVCPANLNVPERPTSFLIVGKDSPIKTARDLEGKTLGTQPLKSLGDYAVAAWMEVRRADFAKVKWVEIPFVACADAIARGRIDGAFVVEPFGTQARASTRVLGRPYVDVARYFYGGAYFATSVWANAHVDVVKRFVAAIRDASRWANANPAKSAVILEKYSHVDHDTLLAMTRVLLAERTESANLQATIDFAAKYKIIDGPFLADDLIFRPSR
jgi:NitT/TauT family transport system substrate-binding protein